MEATQPAKKHRSQHLLNLDSTATRLYNEAYVSYNRDDFAAASRAFLACALQANREGLPDWANEYGKKHAAANRKACGG